MMKAKFLLPCQCGNRIAILERQAGEVIQCQCGNSLRAPSLRNLRTLDREESSESSPKESTWSRSQGAMFVAGLLVTLLAAFSIWYLLGERRAIEEYDVPLDRFLAAPSLDALSYEALWAGWDAYRWFGLDFEHTASFEYFSTRSRTLQIYLIASGFAAALGIGLLIVACFLRAKPG